MSDRASITYCEACKKSLHKRRESACAARRELRAKGKHNTKPGNLNVYPCPHGNGWHVGHAR